VVLTLTHQSADGDRNISAVTSVLSRSQPRLVGAQTILRKSARALCGSESRLGPPRLTGIRTSETFSLGVHAGAGGAVRSRRIDPPELTGHRPYCAPGLEVSWHDNATRIGWPLGPRDRGRYRILCTRLAPAPVSDRDSYYRFVEQTPVTSSDASSSHLNAQCRHPPSRPVGTERPRSNFALVGPPAVDRRSSRARE